MCYNGIKYIRGNEMALNGKAMVKYHNDMNNIFLKGFKRNELILFFYSLSNEFCWTRRKKIFKRMVNRIN